MSTIDNLRDRAKKIKAAFLPDSVTNEEEGMLFIDIINFLASNTIDGGSDTLNKTYWNKEELQFLEQYIIAFGEKIKACYADEAAHAQKTDYADEAKNSKLWDKALFKDYLDQSVRTSDLVKFRKVIAEELIEQIEEIAPELRNLLNNTPADLLTETSSVGKTLGALENVDDTADEASNGALFIRKNDTWSFVVPQLSNIQNYDGLLMPVFNTQTKEWVYIAIPGDVVPPIVGFPYTFPLILS